MMSRGGLSLLLVFKLLLASGFFSHKHNSTTAMAPNAHNFAPMPAAEEAAAGQLELLKREEARLSEMLSSVRRQKLSVLRSRPLTIGVVGFGRFGQFISRKFSKYGNVVGTSRSNYTDVAAEMGARYIPLENLDEFVSSDLDVIVVAVSIVSFEDTIRDLVPHLQRMIETTGSCPLIVDVLSVKDHARKILLDNLPIECDVLCTHPMFGPDSAKHSWKGTNFVYERTRVDKVLLDASKDRTFHHQLSQSDADSDNEFVDETGTVHDVHEGSEAHVAGMDRMERFLSIWEEEGCNMISMSCKSHDEYTASSQFITHLVGRVLGEQGLEATPIDTKGFQSVLRLIETTTADSFDLFYGLYKYNQNSKDIIVKLKESLGDVVNKLVEKEGSDSELKSCL